MAGQLAAGPVLWTPVARPSTLSSMSNEIHAVLKCQNCGTEVTASVSAPPRCPNVECKMSAWSHVGDAEVSGAPAPAKAKAESFLDDDSK